MKATLSLTILLCLIIPLSVLSQGEPMNTVDANGAKHGKWMIYLDANWAQIDDREKAVYVRYNYFDHGVSLYPMGPSGKKGFTLEMDDQTGNKMLNGTYKWMDKNGKLSATHVFKNGKYISCKEYFPSGQLQQHFDYTKKWGNEQHSWHLTIYDKTGKVVYNFDFHKNEDGTWPKTKG